MASPTCAPLLPDRARDEEGRSTVRVDTVLVNGVIHTGAQPAPVTELAIHRDRIVAVGADCDGLEATRRVDLAGLAVVPGFHDAHNHMAWFGMSLDEVQLSSPPLRRVEEIYDLVAARAAAQPEGTWIIGSGYDQNKLEGAHPHRDALDRIAPRHHVWLRHSSGHMCVVNSLVLDQLDLANVPAGGDIVVDADGRPSGLLREQAQLLLRPLTYPTPVDVLVRGLAKASERYLADGITSVQEAGVGGGWIGRTPVEIGGYQLAREQGALRVRTTLMVALESLHDLERHPTDPIDVGLDLGIRSGFGDDWLRIGPVKIFADGSLIGRTAAMSSDYADDPGNRGYFQLPVEDLRRAIRSAHRSGWQIATHAIGDLAVTEVIDAYASALAETPRPDHRHRIEHCGVSRPEDVARMAELGIIPVPQGRFVNEIGDGMRAALGEQRMAWCYRARSFLDAGLPLPGSSDRPVVEGAPLLGLADLVKRQTSTGAVLASEERLTPAEALRAFTWGSAYAAFRENEVGTLAPGWLADLAVLSADPLDVLGTDADASLHVVATMIGGNAVYDPDDVLAP
jgi:predicted amidohydrolase YtcJ